MIPAILAAPMVQGVIGGVINGVMSCFSSPQTSAPTEAFGPHLDRATAVAPTMTAGRTAGTLSAIQWNQMSDTDSQLWLKSLSGRHVDATDAMGRTISGVVDAVQVNGGQLSLSIGGQTVNLSQLKQISWSSTAI